MHQEGDTLLHPSQPIRESSLVWAAPSRISFAHSMTPRPAERTCRWASAPRPDPEERIRSLARIPGGHNRQMSAALPLDSPITSHSA
jgi:hypothetical protein